MNKHLNISSLMVVALGSFMLAALLCGCGEKKAKVDVNAQIAILKSGDASKKADALAALTEAGPDAAPAVPILTETLKDPDPLSRRLAAAALGGIGPAASSAVPTLKPLLADSDRDVVTATVNALRAIDPSSVPKQAMPNVTQ